MLTGCEWQLRQPWQPHSSKLCGVETPFLINRSHFEDMDLALCSDHLATYIYLNGPQKVELVPGVNEERKKHAARHI